jgi:hypothetical protein
LRAHASASSISAASSIQKWRFNMRVRIEEEEDASAEANNLTEPFRSGWNQQQLSGRQPQKESPKLLMAWAVFLRLSLEAKFH